MQWLNAAGQAFSRSLPTLGTLWLPRKKKIKKWFDPCGNAHKYRVGWKDSSSTANTHIVICCEFIPALPDLGMGGSGYAVVQNRRHQGLELGGL